MLRTLQSPADLWYFRKRMSVQMATFIFMTNLLSINSRVPHRVHFARGSGLMTTSDMLPCALSLSSDPHDTLSDALCSDERYRSGVHQQRVGAFPTDSEHPASPAASKHRRSFDGHPGSRRAWVDRASGTLHDFGQSAACLPRRAQYDLGHRLSIFVRDEVVNWYATHAKKTEGPQIREQILSDIDDVVKRAKLFACTMERAAVSPTILNYSPFMLIQFPADELWPPNAALPDGHRTSQSSHESGTLVRDGPALASVALEDILYDCCICLQLASHPPIQT